MLLSLRALTLLVFLSLSWNSLPAQSNSSAQESEASETPTFRTTVRRVIVDVVVRDSNNKPVHGLTASDFMVAEDGHPQSILSFDVHDFESPSIALPPNAPHQPVNHFVNIPATPERGPLYVILYDLVNMEIADQIDARRQVLKFINSKPHGTRFALFVRSDSLYLVQGFTEDKDLLFAALDPKNSRPHVPRVFLMGHNHGYGDPVSILNVITQVTEFLEGMPGHKNLIWLAGTFPLALFPRKDDPREYEDQIIAEINVLTRAQVAVYPINVGGVPVNPAGALTGARPHGGNSNDTIGSGGNSLNTPDSTGMLSSMQAQGSGDSVLTDYAVQRSLARSTGGRAFFSSNDLAAALEEATDVGGNYYSLTYSPSNQRDDGGRRSIGVTVTHRGYDLSYRRYYFTTAYAPQVQLGRDEPGKDPSEKDQPGKAQVSDASAVSSAAAENDPLQPNMKHGAPMIHDLLFSAYVRADGLPARATAEQMAQLANEPAYFRTTHKNKPPAPVNLQRYAIDYRVTDLSLKALLSGKPLAFEFAAAAFDADSRMLNGVVNEAAEDSTHPEANKSGIFRVRQQLDVPINAAWIRIGVRDQLTNRMGTLEVQLPIARESSSR
jgi:VWFA-related protein